MYIVLKFLTYVVYMFMCIHIFFCNVEIPYLIPGSLESGSVSIFQNDGPLE